MPVADHLRGLLAWQGHPWLWWLDAAAVVLALLMVGYVLRAGSARNRILPSIGIRELPGSRQQLRSQVNPPGQ